MSDFIVERLRDRIEALEAEVGGLRDMLSKIGRIPGVADRAGVGDGSVHDAVVTMYGASVADTALVRQALACVVNSTEYRLGNPAFEMCEAALRERLGEKP